MSAEISDPGTGGKTTRRCTARRTWPTATASRDVPHATRTDQLRTRVARGTSQPDRSRPFGVATMPVIAVVWCPSLVETRQNHPAGSLAASGTNWPRWTAVPEEVIVTVPTGALAAPVAVSTSAATQAAPTGGAAQPSRVRWCRSRSASRCWGRRFGRCGMRDPDACRNREADPGPWRRARRSSG